MKIFTDVQALKEAHLKEGGLVKTKGYASADDGNGLSYFIKTAADFGGTPDAWDAVATILGGSVVISWLSLF